MQTDQRNSGTLRNRRLFKMRHAVTSEFERKLTKALITRAGADALEVGALAITLDRLQEIRDSQDLPAPAKWEDLKPTKQSDEVMRRGVEELAKEKERLAARDAQRRQKVEDGLKKLGLK